MLKLNVTEGMSIRSGVFQLGNFQNPSTTTPIPFIQTFLTKPDDTPKAVFITSIMVDLTPERIESAYIETSSNVIGAKSLTFTVRFTNRNVMHPNH